MQRKSKLLKKRASAVDDNKAIGKEDRYAVKTVGNALKAKFEELKSTLEVRGYSNLGAFLEKHPISALFGPPGPEKRMDPDIQRAGIQLRTLINNFLTDKHSQTKLIGQELAPSAIARFKAEEPNLTQWLDKQSSKKQAQFKFKSKFLQK